MDDRIRLSYRNFSDIINSVSEKLDIYTTNIELESLDLSKDYLLTSKREITDLCLDSNKLVVNEIKIEDQTIETESFSKKLHEYISKEQQKNIDLGLKMHSILENIDFKNPNFDDIEDEFYKTKVINFYNKLGDVCTANIYQEYEFKYEENNIKYHGIIDLMLEYPDYIKIIDYKLKNVKDEAYTKQLTGYKNYVEKISGKSVRVMLYSILDETFEEVM